jgi:isoquinoline 1-oxidoreductase beta subunit
MPTLKINGELRRVSENDATPLLWVLRDTLGLKGTKYGCGVGICGICTVLVDDEPAQACVLPISALDGRNVVTIEGLASQPHALIEAWIAEQVPQCGYCQPGQIMAAAALLNEHPRPDDAQIDQAMSGVLCRCGTYQRIRRAIHRAARAPGSIPSPGSHRPEAPRIGATTSVLTRNETWDGTLLDAQGRFAPNPWVRIDAGGQVTVVIDRSDMGQGATTGLAMLVAEELEVELDRVQTEFAPADPAYVNPRIGEQLTGGSTSIRAAWEPLRKAGAQAREMLIQAGAATLNVSSAECRAQDGHVIDGGSGRRIGYGELIRAAARLPLPQQVDLKPASEWRLLGRSTPRLEIPEMVRGRTRFGIDSAPQNALIAVVARSPQFGGAVEQFDEAAALSFPGVHRVIAIESGVAVVADSFWSACKGREALRMAWRNGPNAHLDDAAIRDGLETASRRRGKVVRDDGDVQGALVEADTVLEATYDTPYLAHATLEPMNCAAHVRPDGCDVWVGTQAQQGAWDAAARESGLPKDKVRIHSVNLGGGFGRRLEHDVLIEAVRLSKALGAPVQVLHTRDDDLRHDYYRPAHRAVMRAALHQGRPVAWWAHFVGPGLALDGIDMPYSIPNVREEHVRADLGVPTGPWRSVGASQNAFIVECFIDELAHAAGKDPLAFRLELLGNSPRHCAVLELAARESGWQQPTAIGRGRGIAVYRSFGSWVAQVAEVSVSADARVRVHRVVCAIDCGTTVNPNAVVAQIEGGIAFGLSATLHEAIHLQDGAVLQGNFEEYPLLTLREMPEVEVHLLHGSDKPGGVGEPGVPPIAPAVANAVFAATGERLRALPLRPTKASA